MALSKFKKGGSSAITGDNSVDIQNWHKSTGGFSAVDTGNITLQSLKSIRKEQFDLATDDIVESEEQAKIKFKEQSKNGRQILKIRGEVAKEVVNNNKALADHVKTLTDCEITNQQTLGDMNKHLQGSRVKMARIASNGHNAIEQATSKVSAIFGATKQSIKESIF